jgi:ParB-like chromosome segregation protein Spo0J
MPKLAINKIKVRNRFRTNLGDIHSLAVSIEEVGLLHPLVARPDGRLIAGKRRLAACKKLGWRSVPVTFVDLKEVIRGEFAENAYRKDFLPSEIDAIRRALLPLEKAAAKERQRFHGSTANPEARTARSMKYLDGSSLQGSNPPLVFGPERPNCIEEVTTMLSLSYSRGIGGND